MKRKVLVRLAALPFATALVALPAVSGCEVAKEVGCPEFSEEGKFGEDLNIDADVKIFMQASGQLQLVGREMVANVGAACVDIALAAGRDASAWAGKQGVALVQAACPEADAGLSAVLADAQGVSIQFLVEGGECRASLRAATDCYARCDVSGGCTPAQIEAHCEPGKLAGTCNGQCTGTCQGGTVQCQGECSATCAGDCDGNCIGECDGDPSRGRCDGQCVGECTGACNGTCNGACDVQGATCQGTCTGDCSVELQKPYCTGNFQPPECDIDADCRASCDARLQAEAECTPPKVTYDIVGEGTDELRAVAGALEKHLPILLEAAVVRGPDAVEAALALADSATAIVDKAGTLTAKAGLCAAAAADAAVSASIDIQVSVKASASIEGTARAGTGR